MFYSELSKKLKVFWVVWNFKQVKPKSLSWINLIILYYWEFNLYGNIVSIKIGVSTINEKKPNNSYTVFYAL